MALENLENVFKNKPPNESDTKVNLAKKTPIENDVVKDSVFDDIVKIQPILFRQPDSPQTTQSDIEIIDGKIKTRQDNLFQNLGQNNQLGRGVFTLETLFKNNHRGSDLDARETITVGNNEGDGTPILVNTLRSGIGDLDNLDIKGYSSFFRNGIGFLKEPYIVHNIPKTGFGSALQGVGQNRDFIPFRAALDDVSRLAQFYTSPAGLAFIAKENITNVLIGDKATVTEPLGFVMAPPVPVPTTGFLNFYQQSVQGLGLGSIRKPFKIQYSDKGNVGLPFNTMGDRTIGIDQVLARTSIPSDLPEFAKKGLQKLRDGALKKLESVAQLPALIKKTPFLDLSGGPSKNHIGKYQDLVNKRNPTISDDGDTDAFVKGDFYVKIKDLREHGRFIYFRGFVTGITENVNPSFTSTNYIGRSEPVYQYERADRDLSFNLRVYPNNDTEQKIMYEKLEALTNLAYPHYLKDDNNNSRTRMQAPFTELYMAHIGTPQKGQFGFIKSISYTVPGEGDWDALRALPRLFDISISYQILSKKPPSLHHGSLESGKFYGSGR